LWSALLCVIVGVVGALAFGASARAAVSTWSGQLSLDSPNWSDAGNWQGKVAPPLAAGTMEFPPLTGECSEPDPEADLACYFSVNDQVGRSAQALRLDDADPYVLGGEELTLGAGGLTAFAPEHSSGIGSVLELPIKLGASQTWKIEGNGRQSATAVEVNASVSGSSSALTLELGPVTIRGANPSLRRTFENGVVYLEGDLNASDLALVKLDHAYVTGNAAVGPLTTTAAVLNVGYGFAPTGEMRVAAANFDMASMVELKIAGSGAAPGQDYSQLSSTGEVTLNGATLVLRTVPPGRGQECAALAVGTSYTLVSTTGALSGSFGNAPEGALVPVESGECGHHPERQLQIAYHRGAGLSTVTGTVVEDAEEAGVRMQREAEARRAGERAVAEAYAKRRAEEEAAARSGVLSSQVVSVPAPKLWLIGSALKADSAGTVKLQLACSGETSSSVTATLRTANAVAASRRAVLTLASGRNTIACGQTAAVKLHLSGRARRLLARLHSLRVRVVVSGTFAGGPRTAAALMTLRAPKHH
jgi:hypothetical protein